MNITTERYAAIILNFIERYDKKFFANNFTTQKLTNLRSGQIREATKKLKKMGILKVYGPGVYSVDWTLISKNRKS